ncbi:MAG: ABC transporter ATP-binding protein [Gammaproteobacteria bacterium]|nr:MAG: ABC transporter ATP-binding protein [Gammaproteobacteria bacterium]
MLFISHDLSIVRYMATRVMVMYLGRVMEIAPREVFFTEPRHPYSQALLRSVPVPDPKKRISDYLQAIEGDLPSPLTPPSGCVFRTRCPKATPLCVSRRPPLIADGEGRLLACHHPD